MGADERQGRIVFVTYGFPPAIGGVEAYLGELTPALQQIGWDLVVVCQRTSAGELEGLAVPNVEVRTVARMGFFNAISSLMRASNDETIVHVHAFSRPILLQAFLARGRAPLVLSLHGAFWGPPAPHPSLERLLVAVFDRMVSGPLLRKIDRVLALTPTQARQVEERFVVDHVISLPNMVPHEAFEAQPEPSAPRKRFLALARHDPQKRLSDIVEALRHAPDLPGCDIAGPPGEDTPRLQRATESLPAGRVRLLPPVTGAAKYHLLKSSIALVAPSAWEGQSIAALEAIAQGVPVVTTDRAADGLPLGTYLSFPVGDIDAMEAAMRNVMNPGVSRQLAQGAATAIPALPTARAHALALTKIYQSLLDERPKNHVELREMPPDHS